MNKYFIFLLLVANHAMGQSDTAFARHDSAMKEITVSGRKKTFEQKLDRMVINVKNGIVNAGGSALDVLERSPGITVDRQGNRIAIQGKGGVTLMINGKIAYMPPEALVQFLSGINAGNIEKIELITTPTSKYDAGGNAGFINITLVDNPYSGTSGSYFISGGYGMRESGATGLNISHKGDKIDVLGNVSASYDHYIQTGSSFVQYRKTNDIIANESFTHRDAVRWVENLRIGVDYHPDSATILGVLVSGGSNRWLMTANNGATVILNNLPDTIIKMKDDPESNLWQNLTANIHFQHAYSPGRSLALDANYIYYRDDNPNTYSTDYYNSSKTFLHHKDVKSGKITPVAVRVFSGDYVTPLKNHIKMETGAKLSLSSFTNDLASDEVQFSSHNVLKETIGAVYTSFMADLSHKWSITAGLRYERTDSRLSSNTPDNDMKRKYGQLFPTLSISKRTNEGRSIGLSYTKPINRPTFNDLAPFTIFFDPKTFYSGNPALQPSISHTVQGGYVSSRGSLTLSYTYDDNAIANYYFQTRKIDTVVNILYLSSRNFKYMQDLTANLSLSFTIANWWSTQYNFIGSRRWISAMFEDRPLNLQSYDCNISSTQHFTFSHDISAELSGSYASAIYVGTARRLALYQVNAGIQKKLRKSKDIVQLSANDIFNSGANYAFTEALPSSGFIHRGFDFNLVAYKLTYTHNFGNNGLRKAERVTGAEEELRRVQ